MPARTARFDPAVGCPKLEPWFGGKVPFLDFGYIASEITATDLLDRRVKRERIPAVVRRPATKLGGCSLLDLAFSGRHAEVREAVAAMFDLRRVQP